MKTYDFSLRKAQPCLNGHNRVRTDGLLLLRVLSRTNVAQTQLKKEFTLPNAAHLQIEISSRLAHQGSRFPVMDHGRSLVHREISPLQQCGDAEETPGVCSGG